MRSFLASNAGRLMGAIFVAALLCGGATERSSADSALMVVAAFLSAAILSVLPHDRIVGPLRWFPALVLAAVAIQLAPLPWSVVRLAWPAPVVAAVESVGAPGWAFLTIGVSDTLHALAVTLTACLVFWAYACLARGQRKTVYKAILYGIGLNLMTATAQYMLATPYTVGYFGYGVTIGAFQNGNHFGTLILIAIPALVYLMRRGWLLGGLFMLALSLLLLLGAHTLAGAVLSVVMIVLAWLLVPRHHGGAPAAPRPVVVLALVATAALFVVGFRNQAFENKVTSGARRVDIWETTLRAAQGSKWTGAGYGTFPTAYQIYEKPADVDVFYVNQAHNDYVSMLVEGGFVATALMALYFVLLTRKILHDHRSPYRRIALLGVVAVLLHSAVDYPARTLAILFIFVILNAEFFLPHEDDEGRRRHRGDPDDAEPA